MTKLLVMASIALGVLVILAGVALAVAPPFAATLWGLPPPEGDFVWQRMAAVREVTIGVLIVALALTRQLRALGYLMLLLSPIPLVDFVHAWTHGAGILALQHVPGVPGMIGIGALLLKRAPR
jgi:hypothetical protein